MSRDIHQQYFASCWYSKRILVIVDDEVITSKQMYTGTPTTVSVISQWLIVAFSENVLTQMNRVSYSDFIKYRVSMPNDTGKIKVLSAYATAWDASRVRG